MSSVPLASGLAISRHSEGSAEAGAAEPAYKQLFRAFASSVAVVTADGPDGPVGMTVSSLVAVSLAPPLLLVSLANLSRTLAAVSESGRFAVNLLHDDQQHLAARFATSRPAWVKFAGVALADDASVPVLDRALAAVVCDVTWAHPAGDHTLVLGEIVRADTDTGRPLVWHASGYHALHPRAS
ncbi:MAG: flavin reductase family protein [Dermatophilaceae bacterium]